MAEIKEQTVPSKIGFKVRPMRYSDIDKCLEIWSRVELTEAYQTVVSSLSDDPDGFYVAELNETGKLFMGYYTN